MLMETEINNITLNLRTLHSQLDQEDSCSFLSPLSLRKLSHPIPGSMESMHVGY